MIRRSVRYSPRARDDLKALTEWLSEIASGKVARRYLARLKGRISTLEYGGERGTLRDNDLRIIGIMPSISIAFIVDGNTVLIQRVLYGGQNAE